MPKRVPLGAIGVTREGKTVYPTVGEPFDFTADEVSELNALEKASGNALIRKPINEDSDAGGAGGAGAGEGGKPVAKMNKQELTEKAASLDLDISEAKTNAEIAALIEAKLAADEDL